MTCHETSMETVHALLDVNLQNYLFSRGANDLAVFDRREQELKAQSLYVRYEQKRYSVSDFCLLILCDPTGLSLNAQGRLA